MIKIKYQKKVFGIILLLALLFLFSYRIVPAFNYDNDFGRDISDIIDIVNGQLRLLGPRLSFGGCISGPYYYYLFAIPLLIAKNPAHVLYFSAFLYTVLLSVFYGFFYEKKDPVSTFLLILWLATSRYFLFSVRNPGNAFSYFGFILLFIVLFMSKNRSDLKCASKVRPCWLFGLGFLAGVIANFHFVNLIIFACFWFTWFWFDRSNFKNKIFFIFGGIISFFPQLLFELRHGFVMFKNTFIVKSYENFTNRVLPTALKVSSNPWQNFFIIPGYINSWLQVNFWIIFILVLFFYFKNKKVLTKKSKIIIFTTFTSYLGLMVVARWQFVFHYFLPFLVLWQMSLFLVIKSTRIRVIVFTILLLINLVKFPSLLYQDASRQLSSYQDLVNDVIARKLVTNLDKFNIFVVRETPYAIAGHEYRFYFKRFGFFPLDTFSYSQSDKMLVIAEKGQELDWRNLNTWEFEQFGPYDVVESKNIDDRQIAVLIKKQ